MNMQSSNVTLTQQEQVMQMLHELGFPAHRLGYKQLSVAILRYAIDDTQSLTKDLYPYIANQLHSPDWHAVESSIRNAILTSWKARDPAVWERYFPNLSRVPSNKYFIATLAEYLQYKIPR